MSNYQALHKINKQIEKITAKGDELKGFVNLLNKQMENFTKETDELKRLIKGLVQEEKQQQQSNQFYYNEDEDQQIKNQLLQQQQQQLLLLKQQQYMNKQQEQQQQKQQQKEQEQQQKFQDEDQLQFQFDGKQLSYQQQQLKQFNNNEDEYEAEDQQIQNSFEQSNQFKNQFQEFHQDQNKNEDLNQNKSLQKDFQEEVLEEYKQYKMKENAQLQQSTLSRYIGVLKQFLADKESSENITFDSLCRFLEIKKNKLTPIVVQVIKDIKELYSFKIKIEIKNQIRKYISSYNKMKKLKQDQRKDIYLTVEEYQNIIKEFRERNLEKLADYMTIQASTISRVGDIWESKESDLNLVEMTLKCSSIKTKKQIIWNIQGLENIFQKILEEIRQRKNFIDPTYGILPQYLEYGSLKKNYSAFRQYYNSKIKQVREDLGKRHVTSHNIRKMAFKLDVEENGIDNTVAKTLSNKNIIQKYYTDKKKVVSDNIFNLIQTKKIKKRLNGKGKKNQWSYISH